MAPRLAGGCACGAITFECDVEPIIMLNCHCRNCQRASGSAFAPVVFVPKTGIRLLGKPRYYGRVGDAGKSVERGFCPSCGSQVTMKMERFPDALGLQAGCLDDPSMYKPSMDIFIASAAPWNHMDPDVQKYEATATAVRRPWQVTVSGSDRCRDERRRRLLF